MYIPEPIKCKASWIVEDIIIRSHMEWCSNMYYYVLSDWKNRYVLHWQKKIEPVSWNFCHDWFNLIWTKLPKIWDKYYTVGADSIDSNSTLIASVWEKEYNNNINLPNCSNYNMPYPFNFDSADKCKVIWTIKDYELTRIRPIGFWVRLTIQNWEEIYQVITREDMYFKELIPYYALWWRLSFLIITNRTWDEQVYYPKEWDKAFAIVDKSNNWILKYWLEDYYKYKDIEVCASLKKEEIQKSSFEITEQEKVIYKIKYLHMREKVFWKELWDEKIDELSWNTYFSKEEIESFIDLWVLAGYNWNNPFWGWSNGFSSNQEQNSLDLWIIWWQILFNWTWIILLLVFLLLLKWIYKNIKIMIKQKTLEIF